MVVHPGAVDAAGLAIDLGDRGLQAVFNAGGGACGAIGGGGLAVSLILGLSEFSTLCRGLVNVTANLEITVPGSRGSSAGFPVSVLILGTLKDDRVGGWLPRLEATGSVADDLEVTGKRRADLRWSLFGIDLWAVSTRRRID